MEHPKAKQGCGPSYFRQPRDDFFRALRWPLMGFESRLPFSLPNILGMRWHFVRSEKTSSPPCPLSAARSSLPLLSTSVLIFDFYTQHRSVTDPTACLSPTAHILIHCGQRHANVSSRSTDNTCSAWNSRQCSTERNVRSAVNVLGHSATSGRQQRLESSQPEQRRLRSDRRADIKGQPNSRLYQTTPWRSPK